MKNYKPPFTITSKIVNLISEISEDLARIELTEKSIISPRLRRKNRVKTLAGTLEIEGNHLGEKKITAILEGKRVLGSINEIAEVEGAINAYKELGNFEYDSLEHLLNAHKILMSGLVKKPGTFRKVQVGVGSHIAPQSHLVPGLMKDLFSWLKNSDEHPLIKSCVFHFEFEFIHPFADGNGRIGRLWQTVILYSWKKVFGIIPTESIIRDNQDRYYEMLEQAGNFGDSTCFIEFMLEVILNTVESSVKSSVKSSVNTEQIILKYLKKNPEGTIREISEKLDLTVRAIEKQVSHLKASGKLKRIGSARKGIWEVL